MDEYNGYYVGFERRFPKVIIKAKGKGALPKVLQGGFRTKHSAMRAIDAYLSTKEKEESSNAKKKSTSGDK